jgi:hypothetical protein
MDPKMPCHISDGPQTPEDVPISDTEAQEEDPTPWCHGCGAMDKDDCYCGPIADNH